MTGRSSKGEQVSETVEMNVTALADAAVELWRLQQWAFTAGFERDRAVARRVVRTLDSVLNAAGFEVCDLVGHVYDPGLPSR